VLLIHELPYILYFFQIQGTAAQLGASACTSYA
jgi:hypothetical protein